MKELPIKRILSEETRLGTITIKGRVYDEHEGLGDDKSNYYITKHGDPNSIYAVFTKEIYEILFD